MIYFFPFVVGCSIVLAMVQNGRLAEHVGVKNCSLINFITGVSGAVLLFVLTKESFAFGQLNNMPLLGYLGGLFGLVIVTLSTIVVTKIPTITSTMLMYTGQLAMGIFIDFVRGTPLSTGKIAGCILIVIGVYFNNYIDSKQATQASSEQTSSSLLGERLLD